MSISISSSVTPAASASSASSASVPQEIQQNTNRSSDTVKLSASQQVHQLYEQGQKVSQIAFNLNLTVDTVNSYLGISAATT